MNQVDGVTGGDDSDEIAGDFELIRTDFLFDHVEGPQGDSFGFFHARSGGSAEPDAQEASVGIGEDFRADAREHDVDDAFCPG